jgi:hypothetical protein
MNVETLAPETKTLRRRSALEPYLVKLDAALRRLPPDGATSLKVTVGEASLLIEPWITSRADPRNAPSGGEHDRTELLRQSLALWLKGSVDVSSLRDGVRNGSGNLYGLQAELMLDSAFGSALVKELQDGVDAMVKAGDLEEAKRFSKFQHQVRCVVREIKQSIAESNGQRVDELVEQLTDHQPAPPTKPVPMLRETEQETPAPRRRPRPTVEKPVAQVPQTSGLRYRTELLIALDIVALVVVLFLKRSSGAADRSPRDLTHADFPNAAALSELVAHPPALYATIDEKTWSEFDDKQKRRFVDGMGSVLLTKSYGGLLLKTPNGRIVAEWLEKGGTHLLGSEPIVRSELEGAPPPAPAKADPAGAKYSRFVP